MPEKRQSWTATEQAALDSVAGMTGIAAYHKFGDLTNYSRSFNAFEKKRRVVTADSPAYHGAKDVPYAAVPAPVVRGNEDEFIGITTAFWDLETTFSRQPIVLYGAIADNWGRVRQFRKGASIIDDHALVVGIRDALLEYDHWVGWNSILFDQPILNARLIFHGETPLPAHLHTDLMYKASGASIRAGSRSLKNISEYFDVPNRKTPLNVRTWDAAMSGDEEAYNEIGVHCDADVLVTRDVFKILKPQIRNYERK